MFYRSSRWRQHPPQQRTFPFRARLGVWVWLRLTLLVIYNNPLLFGDTALLLLPQVLLWTQEVTDKASSLSRFGFWVSR